MPSTQEMKKRSRILGYRGWHLDKSTSAARFTATSFMDAVMDTSMDMKPSRQLMAAGSHRDASLPEGNSGDDSFLRKLHVSPTPKKEELDRIASAILSTVSATLKERQSKSSDAKKRVAQPFRPQAKKASTPLFLEKLSSTKEGCVKKPSQLHPKSIVVTRPTSNGFTPFKQQEKSSSRSKSRRPQPLDIPKNSICADRQEESCDTPTSHHNIPGGPTLDAVTKSPVGGLVNRQFVASPKLSDTGKLDPQREQMRLSMKQLLPSYSTKVHPVDKFSMSSGEDSPVDVWKFPMELPSPDSNAPTNGLGSLYPLSRMASADPFQKFCLPTTTAPNPFVDTSNIMRQLQLANAVVQKQLLSQYGMLHRG